jgi:GNAT superfamily N-acetyltransferase
MNKKDLITTRPYAPGDKAFVLSCWLRGLYYGDSIYSEIPKDVFMANYHTILERYVDDAEGRPLECRTITVACLKDDPEVILGYSCSRCIGGINVLDWVFVKSAWRGIGIGKSLVTVPVHVTTHLTKLGKSLKPKECVFNPFLF